MRKLLMIAALIAVALPSLAATENDMRTPSGWFDMAECAFCKNLVEEPGLLDHTTWEGHSISNGVVYIMTVEPGYAEAMAKAATAMQKVGTEIQSGQRNPMTTPMCGHCQEFGMIMMTGTVHMETVQGEAAEVSLFTSEDENTVERLQAMVQRDHEEMALMSDGHEGDHEGHDHH